MNNEQHTPSHYIISFLTLRKFIGILGISLPVLLMLGTFIFGSCTQVQNSISHYYFTIMGDLYVGTLSAVAMFLISYKGYNKTDDVASSLAGIFALGSAYFATSNNPDIACSMRVLPDQMWREIVHYASSALFFITLAFISLFLFTKSEGGITDRKKIRNVVYRTCGIVMLAALILIVIYKSSSWMQLNMAKYKPVFFLEWLALIAFGTSWLVKGKALLVDK